MTAPEAHARIVAAYPSLAGAIRDVTTDTYWPEPAGMVTAFGWSADGTELILKITTGNATGPQTPPVK
jgi:hypothetical protein